MMRDDDLKNFFPPIYLYKRDFLAVFFDALAALSADITLIGSSAYLIAAAAFRPPLYTLSVFITLVRAAGISRAVLRYLERLLGHKSAFKVLSEVRQELFNRAERDLPLKNAANGQYLHDLTSGADILQDFYLRGIIPTAAIFVLSVIAALILLPIIGANAFIIILLFVLHMILSLVGKKHTDTDGNDEARYRLDVIDAALAGEDISAAGANRFFENRLNASADKISTKRRRQNYDENLQDAILTALRNLFLTYILFLLGNAVVAGKISGIALTMIILSLVALCQSFAAIPPAARLRKNASSVANRLLGCSYAKISSSRIDMDCAPILEGKNISFYYDCHNDEKIIDGLNFSVNNSEKIAIVGESGRGKTTLLCLILKLFTPQEGALFLSGRDYRQISAEDIRRNFGANLQGEYIFSGTIRSLFKRLLPNISDDDIDCALKAACLGFPPEKNLDDDAANLSGGERNRLKTALAIAADAPIIVLDEPSAGLDKKNTHLLADSLIERAKGRALIVITHDEELASRMDRIICL